MSSFGQRENPGNRRDNTLGIGENVRVISYNIPDEDRPGGIKVRFKIRIATGKRAREIDARQARAIMEVLASMSQARRPWLLPALESVFWLNVCSGSGGWRGRVPGARGAAPAPTAPGRSSYRVAGMVSAVQLGAGSAHSRSQQVMNACLHGQCGLILRIFLRACRTSRAGMCQRR